MDVGLRTVPFGAAEIDTNHSRRKLGRQGDSQIRERPEISDAPMKLRVYCNTITKGKLPDARE
jgi:2-iminoacetate synthase ThiH